MKKYDTEAARIIGSLTELGTSATPGPFYATSYTGKPNERPEDDTSWTVGPDAKGENWNTDSQYPGYGLTKPDAELLAFLRTNAPLIVQILKEYVCGVKP